MIKLTFQLPTFSNEAPGLDGVIVYFPFILTSDNGSYLHQKLKILVSGSILAPIQNSETIETIFKDIIYLINDGSEFNVIDDVVLSGIFFSDSPLTRGEDELIPFNSIDGFEIELTDRSPLISRFKSFVSSF